MNLASLSRVNIDNNQYLYYFMFYYIIIKKFSIIKMKEDYTYEQKFQQQLQDQLKAKFKSQKKYYCTLSNFIQNQRRSQNIRFVNTQAKIKKDATQPREQIQSYHTQNYDKQQKNIKNYIKAIKKVNQDVLKNQARQSENIQKQSNQKEWVQLWKFKSQYKAKAGSKLLDDNQDYSIELSLDVLQKKVQQLLYLKLMKKSHDKCQISFRSTQDDIERDLQQLICQLQQYAVVGELNNEIKDQIKQISQKIGIIQKIIAESFTESQMLKKYYFIKKLVRVPFTNFQTKVKQTKQQIYYNKSSCLTSKYPSIHFSTISHTSFTKPKRQAYQIEKRMKNKYEPNRQILQKTSYQCDYLNYGTLPTYKCQKNSQKIYNFISHDKKNSIYQTDFKEKKIQLINSAELDCRRDKFRPTNISFMPKRLLAQQKQNKSYLKAKNSAKLKKKESRKDFKQITNTNLTNYNTNKQCNILRNSYWFGNSIKSEYISKFSGEKAILECLAKQSSLSNLKYQFKKQANA